jgi:hypothetical protein
MLGPASRQQPAAAAAAAAAVATAVADWVGVAPLATFEDST